MKKVELFRDSEVMQIWKKLDIKLMVAETEEF